MQKALMIYASMSGNTEDIAGIIKETLSGHQIAVDCLDMDEANADSLEAYDYVFVGTHMGMVIFLTKRKILRRYSAQPAQRTENYCFGSGDHAYPKFCEAVTLFCDAFEYTEPIYIRKR